MLKTCGRGTEDILAKVTDGAARKVKKSKKKEEMYKNSWCKKRKCEEKLKKLTFESSSKKKLKDTH